jgi:hypothetical protein
MRSLVNHSIGGEESLLALIERELALACEGCHHERRILGARDVLFRAGKQI